MYRILIQRLFLVVAAVCFLAPAAIILAQEETAEPLPTVTDTATDLPEPTQAPPTETPLPTETLSPTETATSIPTASMTPEAERTAEATMPPPVSSDTPSPTSLPSPQPIQRGAALLPCVPISFGSPATQQSLSTDEEGCFTFSGNIGDVIRVEITVVSGNFGDQTLNRPNSTTLDSTIFTEGTYTLDADGTHTLIVDPSGSSSLNYDVHIQRLNNPVGCTALNFGNPSTQRTTAVGDVECFTFSGNAGDVIRVEDTVISGNFGDQEIARPDGSTLDSSIFTADTYILDATGTHTLIIDPAGTSSLNHRIHIQRLNNPLTCTALSFGNPSTQRTTAVGDVDCFTFSGTTGDFIRVEVTVLSGNFVDQEIARPDGSTLDSSIFTADTYILDATGTHTLVIDPAGTSSLNYRVHIQRLNNPLTCTALNFGNPSTQRTTAVGDVECFTFTGNTGDIIRVEETVISGNFADQEIVRPDGSTLDSSIFTQDTYILDATGTHTLLIDPSGTSSLNHRVHIQRLNNPVGCIALGIPGTSATQSTSVGNIGCFTFSGTSGTEVQVEILVNNGNFADQEVTRPDGTTLDNSIFRDETYTLDTTGTHTLLVDPSGTSSLSYRVRLTCASCPPPPKPPGPPTLQTPANRASLNDNTPAFAWMAVIDATSYQLQVDNSCNFRSPEIDTAPTPSTFTATTPLPDGRYCWRVRGINAGGAGRWSRKWRFTIDTIAPDAPLLRSPKADAVSSNAKPRLIWRSVRGAKTYHLQIDNEPTFANPLIVDESGLRRPLYRLTEALPQGTYHWRVVAIDAAGNESVFSEVRMFSINIMRAPRDGQTIRSSKPVRVSFKWSRVPGALGYELEIATSPAFGGTVIYSVELTRPNHRLPTVSALTDGTYYWRVNLNLGSGLVDSPFSRMFMIVPRS
ncbi:MAG: hypothetical protein K8L99_08920 [Anaerolineae bacterium]|nr:hypothetical protein [Anaerolineae bacterium]